MAVIIDEINAEVEAEPRQADERQAPSGETPQQAQTDELRRMLRLLERRKMRLKAD